MVTTLPPDPFTDSLLFHPRNATFSTPFLVSPLNIILRDADHSLTICKAISYIFQHWDTLTATPEDRSRLLDLLLDPVIFQRLVLFWSQSVRSYIVRLIVFRLSHLKDRIGGPTEAEIETITRLNARVEAIRKRHAELEQSVLGSILEDEVETEEGPGASGRDSSLSHHAARASTPAEDPASPVGGIKRSRSTIAMLPPPPLDLDTVGPPNSKAEQLLGLRHGSIDRGDGLAEVIVTAPAGAGGDKNALGKATSWFKKSFGGGNKKKRNGSLGGGGDSTGGSGSGRSPISESGGGRKVSLAGIKEVSEEPTSSPRPSRDLGIRGGDEQAKTPTSARSFSSSSTSTSGGPNQPPPLFSQLPQSPTNPNDFLSPTRSSFESSILPLSPADSAFNDRMESQLLKAETFRSSTGGLVLPPPSSLVGGGPRITEIFSESYPNSNLREDHDDDDDDDDVENSPHAASQSSSVDTSRSTTPTRPLSSHLHPPAAQAVFTFEFANSPRSDAFDAPPLSPFSLPPPNGSSSTSSTGSSPRSTSPTQQSLVAPPTNAPSQRMSRSFSRRSSLLTPLAQSVLDGLKDVPTRPQQGALLERQDQILEDESETVAIASEVEKTRKAKAAAAAAVEAKGYERKLHPYAVRFFAEVEDCMGEYHELVWFPFLFFSWR